MLKHVQISPLRHRADSLSIRSTTSCASSICGSPEPVAELQRTPSRASSYSSLSDNLPQTTIKVFTSCLKIDIEYKTLGIQWESTSKEVITQLLRRLKMRHRDPRLFYLVMEVSVPRAGVKTVLVLDNDTRPAVLQACHPKGESRFCLQLKPGGLIRVHTSALQPLSQYKSLVISEETTSDELLQLLLSCYNLPESVEQFSIYEVCPGQEYQRKLHPDDLPLRAQIERTKRGETCHFLVRRNPTYARRRQLLSALNDTKNSNKSFDHLPLDDSASLLDMSFESLSDDLGSLMTTSDEDEDCNSNASSVSSDSSTTSTSTSASASSSSSSGSTPVGIPKTIPTPAAFNKIKLHKSSLDIRRRPITANEIVGSSTTTRAPTTSHISTILAINETCVKCGNNYKSCEFCQKNSALMHSTQRSTTTSATTPKKAATSTQSVVPMPNSSPSPTTTQLVSYSPVYNIREIRTASHSFSSLGNDKKLLDIHLHGRFDAATCRMRPQSCVFIEHAAMTRSPAVSPKEENYTRNGFGAGVGGIEKNGNVVATRNAKINANTNNNNNSGNNKNNTNLKTLVTNACSEAVNNNPAKGLGHFVYI